MIGLMPTIKQQYNDVNGNPLTGGLLYSYIAGTTIPTDTYTNLSGITANTNPIVLDARGEADVWLSSAFSYKFKLAFSDGTEIWTVDDVNVTSSGGGSSTDELVKVNAGDLVGAYLSDKLIAAAGVTLTLVDTAGVITMEASFNGVTAPYINSTSGLTATTINAAIDEVDAQVDTNVTNIATNTTNIATNASDIATNTTGISTNTTNIATNASNIATNTSGIATNTSNIATNTTNIATNTTDIATNTTSIATNTTNIATNATNISSNDTDIAANTTNIATNTANIASNDTDIATNASNIATNTTNIASNASNIATNVTAIGTNTTNIATNATNIATNTSGIATNASDISTNVTNIATNTSDIATNVTNIATNTANITSNDTDIATNVTNIATNTAGIATNVTNIAANTNAIDALAKGLDYQGTWNASTNSPALASSVGTEGHYYIVGTAGNTNLNGITDWKVGDWVLWAESVTSWQKVDNTSFESVTNQGTGSGVFKQIVNGTEVQLRSLTGGSKISFTQNADDIQINDSVIVSDVATNTSDIATNVTDIATNVTDIATNTSDIATNVTAIALNTAKQTNVDILPLANTFTNDNIFDQDVRVKGDLKLINNLSQVIGGIGTAATSPSSPYATWSDVLQSRSGNGYYLSRTSGYVSDGPTLRSGDSGYAYPFTFEHITKDGTGSRTQFAIPYANANNGRISYRGYYNSAWNTWTNVVNTLPGSENVALHGDLDAAGTIKAAGSGTATEFLNGLGTYSVPAGGGGGSSVTTVTTDQELYDALADTTVANLRLGADITMAKSSYVVNGPSANEYTTILYSGAFKLIATVASSFSSSTTRGLQCLAGLKAGANVTWAITPRSRFRWVESGGTFTLTMSNGTFNTQYEKVVTDFLIPTTTGTFAGTTQLFKWDNTVDDINSPVFFRNNIVGNTTGLNSNTDQVVDWTGTSSLKSSSGITHSTSTNPGRITVTQDGEYDVYSSLYFQTTSSTQRAQLRLSIYVDGVLVPEAGMGQGGYARGVTTSLRGMSHINSLVQLTAGQYIEIRVKGDGLVNSSAVNLIGPQCIIKVTKLQGSKGETGATGAASLVRTVTTTTTTTLPSNADTTDIRTVTALTSAMLIQNPSGTPINGQVLKFRITDSGGSSGTLTYGGDFRFFATKPTAITSGKTLYIGCIYNADDTKWDVVAAIEEI